jgi:hypothetical protein
MTKPQVWARLDPYGQVAAVKAFTGDVEDLKVFARKGVEDVARFSREDFWKYYHHPTGRVIHCTLVTMDLPWGSYRYIPVEATQFGRKGRRWRRRRWPL